MDEEQKKLCSRMNIFCGLHLLVGIVNSCEASLKKLKEYKEDLNIG